MKKVIICNTQKNDTIYFSDEDFSTINTFITGLLDEGPLVLYNFENQYSGRELTPEECWDLLYLLKESDVTSTVIKFFMKILEFVSLIDGKLLII
jgi:hypothetical protein